MKKFQQGFGSQLFAGSNEFHSDSALKAIIITTSFSGCGIGIPNDHYLPDSEPDSQHSECSLINVAISQGNGRPLLPPQFSTHDHILNFRIRFQVVNTVDIVVVAQVVVVVIVVGNDHAVKSI